MGKEVTLLARGAWAAEIQKNGLHVKNKFLPRESVCRIPTVTELKADEEYDVIFVVMRYTLYADRFDFGYAAGQSDKKHRVCGQQCARQSTFRRAA